MRSERTYLKKTSIGLEGSRTGRADLSPYSARSWPNSSFSPLPLVPLGCVELPSNVVAVMGTQIFAILVSFETTTRESRANATTLSEEILKVPGNPNACRPLLSCIDLYVPYLTIWEFELVSYILQEFFNHFSLVCYAPPLKKSSKFSSTR